jgi:hypothetical protein
VQILETPRLILREFQLDDIDALAHVICDRETMRFYPTPFDRNGVEEWISRNRNRYAKDGHGLWAMVLKANGELIGDCGLPVQTWRVSMRLRSDTMYAVTVGVKVLPRKRPARVAISDSAACPSSDSSR